MLVKLTVIYCMDCRNMDLSRFVMICGLSLSIRMEPSIFYDAINSGW